MLEIQTSTELMIQSLMYGMILCTLIVSVVLIYLGVRLMTAYEQAQANLATLSANSTLAIAILQNAGQPQGGANEAQVQVLADGMKAASNALANVTPGAVQIP